jgi:hypothetical protein
MGERIRSASSAGSRLASHSPKPRPEAIIKPRKTHAPGQCSVPAGTNSMTAKPAIQASV